MIMILTTRSNDDIAAAQTYYEGRFDESLVDTVGYLSLSFLRFFLLFGVFACVVFVDAFARACCCSVSRNGSFFGGRQLSQVPRSCV